MQKINLDQIDGFNVGEFTPVDGSAGAVRLSRFPSRLETEYLSGGGKRVARQSTGCEIRLVPLGAHLNFRLSSPDGARVLLYQGDFWMDGIELRPGQIHKVSTESRNRLKRLPEDVRTGCRFSPEVMRLVVERGTVYLHAIDSFGMPYRRPEFSEVPRVRWLAYGSSITHADTYGYIFTAADRLGIDVLDKGMSGSCAVEASTAEFLAKDCSWDFMTCEWGINMRESVDPAEFEARMIAALDILLEVGKPVFLITLFPNGCRLDETEPLLLERELAFDNILRREVKRRNISNLQLIEGNEILQSPTWLSADLVHPTHAGHGRMGEHLAAIFEQRLGKLLPRNMPTKTMNFPEWLESAIIYQIYPQSFLDTNGDGIGDLNGVSRKLDYLEQLGVTVLWLNPIFDSPFMDAGYDVRDFFKVAPRYGTEADLVELFAEARKRGMRVILDLVAGHTSIEHPLFQKSVQDPSGKEATRFIWRNRDYDPAAGPDAGNYVKNFFDFQPALNFGYAHPTESWQDPVDAYGPKRNRQYLKKILSYWMERGAAGFRVDMASSLVKEDPGHAETIRLWQELRAWWDASYPDGILVAEWSHPSEAIEAGFHLDFMMHFNVDVYRSLFFNETGTLPYPEGDCYFDRKGTGSARHFMEVYQKQLEAIRGKGFISLPSANHDFQHLRCGSRGWEGLRPAWVFLMTQAGPPAIYMGDEIGMRYVPDTPPREGSTLVGVTAPNAGAINGERAGTRTPMQWDSSPNAGFSSAPADALYLPLDPDTERPDVSSQEADPDSLLHFVRQLVRLRKTNPALGAGAKYRFMNPAGVDYPLVVERSGGQQTCLVIINPSGARVACGIESTRTSARELLGKGCQLCTENGVLDIVVEPFGYAIFEADPAAIRKGF